MLAAGAYPLPVTSAPGIDELLFKHASDGQLAYINPVQRLVTEDEGRLSIRMREVTT
jgi:hypothetical protein